MLLVLSLFGTMVLYSASGAEMASVTRQLTRLSIAMFLMIAMANVPVRLLKNFIDLAVFTRRWSADRGNPGR